MTDRPMIFSGEMVRALLEGRKTQTRQIVKLNGDYPNFCGGRGDWDDPTCWGWEDPNYGDWVTLEKEPGQRMGWRDWVGAPALCDRIWVRETCATWEGGHRDVVYRADISEQDWRDLKHDARSGAPWKVRSSTQMPRWASRLTLTVTDVRVQRVQEISPEDVEAEGIEIPEHHRGALHDPSRWKHDHFVPVWNTLHGPGAWDRNDWVAALSFTVHHANIDALEAA